MLSRAGRQLAEFDLMARNGVPVIHSREMKIAT